MRKLSIVICIILICSLCSVAYAAEPDSPPDPQLGPGITYAESPSNLLPATRSAGTVTDWWNSIAETSSSSVRCSSQTIASSISDYIKVEYVLYKYDGGWQRYKSGIHSKSKAVLFTDAIPFSVDPGYSYYVKTYHRTYSGSTCISTQSTSSGSIYVS